ncbi:MAG: DUF2809 domain-containing protein [Methanobrevibacter sp.]|nr:DUF2809 domain-containing protein [Methanobrevibacter sp.]
MGKTKNLDGLKKINFIILISSIILGLINKFILNHIEFISSYGNDLLAMSVLLSFYSLLFQKHIKLKHGLILWIIGSILGEFIRPLINPNNAVFDWWDIVAYLVGMIVYYGIIGEKND